MGGFQKDDGFCLVFFPWRKKVGRERGNEMALAPRVSTKNWFPLCVSHAGLTNTYLKQHSNLSRVDATFKPCESWVTSITTTMENTNNNSICLILILSTFQVCYKSTDFFLFTHYTQTKKHRAFSKNSIGSDLSWELFTVSFACNKHIKEEVYEKKVRKKESWRIRWRLKCHPKNSGQDFFCHHNHRELNKNRRERNKATRFWMLIKKIIPFRATLLIFKRSFDV